VLLEFELWPIESSNDTYSNPLRNSSQSTITKSIVNTRAQHNPVQTMNEETTSRRKWKEQ